MQTVNVVEHNGDNGDNGIVSLRAFRDTKSGNKKAEKLFVKIAIENGMKQENAEFHLDNGYYSGYYSNDDYTVSIVHSTDLNGN